MSHPDRRDHEPIAFGERQSVLGDRPDDDGLLEHLSSVPFLEVITRHVRIIGSEYFDVSLVQNGAED